MENLNAEAVKKALECCCGDIVECQKCAYVKNGYNRCKERASQDALALITSQEQRIKELAEERNKVSEKGAEILTRLEEAYLKLESENLKLAEENERLENTLVEQSAENVMLIGENKRLKAQVEMWTSTAYCEKDRVDSIKIDTVRKMHSMIRERCIAGCIYPAFIARTVDQIAEELISDGT